LEANLSASHLPGAANKLTLAGFLGSFTLSNYQRSQGAMMTQTLYPRRAAQSTTSSTWKM
jgi:hypothetical protein